MEILTKDNRRLWVLSIGQIDAKNGTDKLKCIDEKGNKVEIRVSKIKCFYGSYAFPPKS